MTEEVYSNHLWDKAPRCGTVFSDRRLKSLFAEGLLPATCAQVRNYLAARPDVDYQSVARYAQAIWETNRASRRQRMSALAHGEPPGAARRFDRTARTRPVLSVESASEIPTAGGLSEEAILAVTDQTATSTSMSSPRTSYYPSPAVSAAGAPVLPANPGDVQTGPYGRQGQETRVRFSGGRFPGPPPCRFCLDTTHRQEECPVVADAGLRAKGLEAREANYQKLRIRQGLRPGIPSNRRGPSAWRGQRQATPAGVNLVDESHPDLPRTTCLKPRMKPARTCCLREKPRRTRRSDDVSPRAQPQKLRHPNPAAPVEAQPGNRTEVQAICFFKKQNYKISATVGQKQALMVAITPVLDSGAGPNVIQLRCVAESWRPSIQPDRSAALIGASNRAMKALGEIPLFVRIGAFVARVPFLVVTSLAVDCILGTTFLDRHVKAILPPQRKFVLHDTLPVALVGTTPSRHDRKMASRSTAQQQPSSDKLERRQVALPADTPSGKIRLVRGVKFPR